MSNDEHIFFFNSQNMGDDRVLETSFIGCKQEESDSHECELDMATD